MKKVMSVMFALALCWSVGMVEHAEAETVLKIGTPNIVKSANFFSDYYLGILAHISNMPLMKMDQDGNLVGLTAERVEVSEDNTTWTFYIRDNLYWSDGEKVTPEDVKFSVEYTGAHNPNAGWIKDTLDEAKVVGEDAVALTFHKPYTRLNLEFATYNILPKHIWENIAEPMQYTNPEVNVGHGPFYLEKVDLNAGIISFAKNPHWQGAQPQIDGFEVHCFKNMDVLSLALEKHDVDTFYKYAGSYPYANVERLQATGDFELAQKLNMGLVFLGMNLKQAPFSDKNFRQAIAYALNYEEIVKLDALGYGEVPNRGFVPTSMGGYTETAKLEYAPEKARALLAEAGYADSNGNGLLEGPDQHDLNLKILVRADWIRVAELLRDYLKAIGIESEIRSADLNTWAAEKDEYNYDLTITRTTPWGMLMHANWGTGYFDSRRTGRGVLHILDDENFLALCDEILATSDAAALSDYAAGVQTYYAEELPAIALYWNVIVTPYNTAFTGWMPDPLYGIYNVDTLLNVKTTSE
jgi:peptide/nickel transport system substrate-binding protein